MTTIAVFPPIPGIAPVTAAPSRSAAVQRQLAGAWYRYRAGAFQRLRRGRQIPRPALDPSAAWPRTRHRL